MRSFLILSVLFFTNGTGKISAQLLWKISGNGLNKPSYLFGTIHLVPNDRFIVWPTVDSAFRSSNSLVMELDLDFSASELLHAAQQMTLPGGETLENYLSSDNFTQLRSYCTDSLKWKKRKFKRYSRMKPFYFSSLILGEQLGKTKGYEQYFAEQAKKLKMPVLGLESMQEQLEAVDAISIKDQAGMLNESIQNGRSEFYSMLEVYLNRDLQTLAKLMQEEGDSVEGFTYSLLTNRNKNWIALLENWLPEKSMFIAVGAGHLPGEAGLIELLIRKGFSVEPVW